MKSLRAFAVAETPSFLPKDTFLKKKLRKLPKNCGKTSEKALDKTVSFWYNIYAAKHLAVLPKY